MMGLLATHGGAGEPAFAGAVTAAPIYYYGKFAERSPATISSSTRRSQPVSQVAKPPSDTPIAAGERPANHWLQHPTSLGHNAIQLHWPFSSRPA